MISNDEKSLAELLYPILYSIFYLNSKQIHYLILVYTTTKLEAIINSSYY